jgi:hypothetical protein
MDQINYSKRWNWNLGLSIYISAQQKTSHYWGSEIRKIVYVASKVG